MCRRRFFWVERLLFAACLGLEKSDVGLASGRSRQVICEHGYDLAGNFFTIWEVNLTKKNISPSWSNLFFSMEKQISLDDKISAMH
jgi:hypothetical protein